MVRKTENEAQCTEMVEPHNPTSNIMFTWEKEYNKILAFLGLTPTSPINVSSHSFQSFGISQRILTIQDMIKSPFYML